MRNYKVEKDFMEDGYRCVIVGQNIGHRCGYVGVPIGHSVYGKNYNEIDIDVHGGLTYSEDSTRDYPVRNDDNLWWIGFDCAHSGDGKDFSLIKELADIDTYNHMLRMERMFPTYEIARTKDYVEKELRNVVKQLKAM